LGTERTLDAMLKAEKKGMLHVQYKGVVQVPQLENRECYMFIRTPYDEKEDEGIYEYTYYIDKENWLQVGSVLKDAEGKLIGSYFFSHFKINPEFKKDQFTKAGM
jgi:outer membrane lipoprotein-sorting protein